MKIVVLTGNAIRHRYVANALSKIADDTLTVSESKINDALDNEKIKKPSSLIEEHYYDRYLVEKEFFMGNDFFISKTLPLLYKEANLPYTYDVIKGFKPDLMVCFGASIIREPLLSLLPTGRFINLHLGLSPYYRGSGTNFWPFVNEELEYVGSTIIHIDARVDTGNIIAHITPKFSLSDTVHTVGCKVIKASVMCLLEVIKMVEEGNELKRVKQWHISNERYYKSSDFNEKALLKYKNNLANGLIERFLKAPKPALKLISL